MDVYIVYFCLILILLWGFVDCGLSVCVSLIFRFLPEVSLDYSPLITWILWSVLPFYLYVTWVMMPLHTWYNQIHLISHKRKEHSNWFQWFCIHKWLLCSGKKLYGIHWAIADSVPGWYYDDRFFRRTHQYRHIQTQTCRKRKEKQKTKKEICSHPSFTPMSSNRNEDSVMQC